MPNYYSLIAESAAAYPADLAIRWPSTGGSTLELTFAQLTRQTHAVRHQLRTQGVQAGDVCLLAIPTSLSAVITILALMAEGAIPLLPPAEMSVTQWLRIRKQYRMNTVITSPRPPLKLRLLSFLLGSKLISLVPPSAPSAEHPPVPVSETQPALITFSSGSTGRPKAIERSHAVLQQQHRALLHHFPAQPRTLDVPLFPNVLLHNLAAGVGTVLPNIPGLRLDRLRPERVIDQLRQERPRTLTGNVYYFTQLVDYAETQGIQLPDVEAVGVGGSPVPEPLLARLQQLFVAARLYVIYGSSEAEPIAVREFTRAEAPLRGYAVGAIHPGLRWKLVPTDRLSDGPTGELWVTGPHVVLPDRDAWFATGDVGYVSQGELFLTARRGNEALVDRKQHYQLEHYLYHQTGVKKAAAVVNGPRFDIFFEGVATIEAVRASLVQVIAPACLGTVRRVRQLPTDRRHHSKILYHRLRT